jgi:hypothetical protein
MDKSGDGAGFLRELRFPLPIYIPSASPQSSSKVALGQIFSENFGFPCQSTFHLLFHNHLHYSPEAGTIGQEWPQCQQPHKPNNNNNNNSYGVFAVLHLISLYKNFPQRTRQITASKTRQQCSWGRNVPATSTYEKINLEQILFPFLLSWGGGAIVASPCGTCFVTRPTTRSRILAEKLMVAHRSNKSTSTTLESSL